MTNEQLEEAVARVKELDAKRTQGEWRTLGEWAVVGRIETIADLYQTHFDCARLDRVADNAAFIATAPLMAQVIRQLWDEREAMEKEMLEQCRIIGAGGERELALMGKVERYERLLVKAMEAIESLRGTIDPDGIGAWSSDSKQAKAAMQALAALESVGV